MSGEQIFNIADDDIERVEALVEDQDDLRIPEYGEPLAAGDPSDKLMVLDHDGEALNPDDIDHRLVQAPPPAVLRAYSDFYNLGPGRSIAELARRYKKAAEIYGAAAVPCTTAATLYEWKKRFHWDLQIRADEVALYRQEEAARFDTARRMGERHAQQGQLIQSLGMVAMREFIDRSGNLTERGKAEISPSEARRMILDGTRLERDAGKRHEEITEDMDDEFSF